MKEMGVLATLGAVLTMGVLMCAGVFVEVGVIVGVAVFRMVVEAVVSSGRCSCVDVKVVTLGAVVVFVVAGDS